jgi:hypothetical protein
LILGSRRLNYIKFSSYIKIIRGPSAAELKPWASVHPDAKCFAQWDKQEWEEIQPIGKIQLQLLGLHFANRYVRSGILKGGGGGKLRTLWRASKSSRGLESGRDFVAGFDSGVGGDGQSFSADPEPHNDDEDIWFRGWRVGAGKAGMEYIKENCHKDPEWLAEAKANDLFLNNVWEALGAPSVHKIGPCAALHQASYLYCLLEVERYWPQQDSVRDAILQGLSSELERMRLSHCARWAWDKRFFQCPRACQIGLGGKLAAEMLRCALRLPNPERKWLGKEEEQQQISVFSGHDYSILSVIGVLGLLDNYEIPVLGFGAYLTLELWEGAPPLHHSGKEAGSRRSLAGMPKAAAPSVPSPDVASNDTTTPVPAPALASDSTVAGTEAEAEAVIGTGKLTLRLVLNSGPFKDPNDHKSDSVRTNREFVLCDLALAEAEHLLKSVEQ